MEINVYKLLTRHLMKLHNNNSNDSVGYYIAYFGVIKYDKLQRIENDLPSKVRAHN